jgi:hypothetical protein
MFLKQFERPAAGIIRGLPSDGDLKSLAVVHIFSFVLHSGFVTDFDFTIEGDTSAQRASAMFSQWLASHCFTPQAQ